MLPSTLSIFRITGSACLCFLEGPLFLSPGEHGGGNSVRVRLSSDPVSVLLDTPGLQLKRVLVTDCSSQRSCFFPESLAREVSPPPLGPGSLPSGPGPWEKECVGKSHVCPAVLAPSLSTSPASRHLAGWFGGNCWSPLPSSVPKAPSPHQGEGFLHGTPPC